MDTGTKLNFLGVNVGNTRAQIGAFVEGRLEQPVSVEHADRSAITEALAGQYAPLREAEQAMVVVASVNDAGLRVVTEALRDHVDAEVCRVDVDLPIPIGRELDPESIVGEDRLLSAAAAYDILKQACVVVDAGTAVTVDLVDGAGTFHGGAIVPGARMMLQAMHEHTALLPDVSLEAPAELIGRNTAEAMRGGVFHGIRGAVRELVEHYAEQIGIYPIVTATGGDAELLFADYPLVERIVPELPLLGMAVTLRRAME